MKRRTILATGIGALLASASSGRWLAQELSAPIPRPPLFRNAALDLAPGEFLWQPELAPDGPIVIIVSISEQLVHVYRNGVQFALSTCSTGRPGHATPTGVFVVLQKDEHHHSSTYNNAPMPNMQRLTWSGIALHAGNLPGYPASHGCVRLPMEFSRRLFAITHLGIAVIIADESHDPQQVAHPGPVLPPVAEAEAMQALEDSEREAEQAQHVASVVVSAADRTAQLLVNGEVAWSSAVTITDPEHPLGNHVYTLLGPTPDGGSFRFMAHGLTGLQETVYRHDEILERIQVHNAHEIHRILATSAPGTTLVVTDLAAGDDTRSTEGFVLIDALVVGEEGASSLSGSSQLG